MVMHRLIKGSLDMPGERITFSEHFERLLARAGLSKVALAQAAGVSRLVIFRALKPQTYAIGGTLRGTTAWKLAKAYAEYMNIELETAFALLFVVERQPGQDATAYEVLDDVPTHTPEEQPQAAGDKVPPPSARRLDGIPRGPMKTLGVRLDEETLRMLAALTEDDERTSQSEMVRVLIKRAYRELVAQRSAAERPPPETPNSDQD
jgi:hypothetical protein